MGRPIGAADLVVNEGIDGFGIGHAQQGFGQAHEGDAFVGGEAIFGEEALHEAQTIALADGGDQGFGMGGDLSPR
ncbi:hypothetical protein FF80_00713 [Devosia sp. LC5]|nr:hypothetical protein FF80_00713 [Devosia sp. LC5]